MNCPEYQDLNAIERRDFMGELLHSCMSDSKYFELAQKIIRGAKRKGLFEGVKIQPADWSNVPPDETVNNIDTPLNETT